MSILWLIVSGLVLLYFRIGGTRAAAILVIATLVGMGIDDWHWLSMLAGAVLLAAVLAVLLPGNWRRDALSRPLLGWVRGLLPTLSATETEALKSGSVDWDGELFGGRPDWQHLLDLPHFSLSEKEQAFVDGPVNTLCEMLDDWAITNEHFDLPEAVWDYIKQQGFFGLVIPESFGGLGFSQAAHSEIVMKLSTRSISAAVTVMVPNSLGPGELLMHYGTDAQKQHYLPRLCAGEEIPCFALTSPVAGSDAGAIPDRGMVCHGEWEGEQVLGLRVTWNKRYITLAPVATVIGLAIKVYDPDHLLGDTENIGVTCVLVPHDLPGVNSGTRHMPMNTVFMNGPTWGDDVFIPLDQVIGGPDMLGRGWTMLLECLSIGRSISLPGLATGAGKLACLVTGAYVGVREQFGRSIDEFEGIQEALEPIAGHTYAMDAARRLTAAMLDRGVRPAVPSAALKYRNTALMREVVNHAMDIVAGRAVISGPRNFMARVYQAVPIGITVEGANILTRSLMVFGQGAIRCHRFIADEIEAAGMSDEAAATEKFDGLFYRHIAQTAGNAVRSLVFGLSHGWLAEAPAQGDIKRYYRQLNRFAAGFSVMTDVTLISIGGGLKARQRLSGRMADVFVQLYYASAVIKQWHEEGYPEDQRPLVEWCLQSALQELQAHMLDAIANYPVAALRLPLRLLIFPLGTIGNKGPDDELGAVVARSIAFDSPVRARIVAGVYYNEDPKDSVGRVLHAARLAGETHEMRGRLHAEMRKTDEDRVDALALLLGHQRAELVDWGIEQGAVEPGEREQLLAALTALYDVIRVDAFEAEGIEEMAAAVSGKRRVVERPPAQ